MAKDPEYGRRHFIKDSVWSLARTAHEFVKHRDAPSEKPEAPRVQRTDWLRPPGAVAEALFTERCTRCGDCLKACPYGSIKAHPQDGFPIILPDEMPCWLCEDLPCIEACETEALLGVGDLLDLKMGLAKVSHADCTASQGCHACVSRCPVHALSNVYVELDNPNVSDYNTIDMAMQCYLRVLEVDPKNLEASFKLMEIALNHKKTDLAIKVMEDAVEHNPDEPLAYYNLISTYDKCKMFEQAEQTRQKLKDRFAKRAKETAQK